MKNFHPNAEIHIVATNKQDEERHRIIMDADITGLVP